MIDLKNTYIENDNGELLELYLIECEKQGAKVSGASGYDFPIVAFMNRHEHVQNDTVHDSGAKQITLADLRKKQGKTVWDAVNLLESSLSNLTNGHVSTAFRLIISGHSTILSGTESTLAQFNRNNTDSHYGLVCIIEEFNQCVKEMGKHDGSTNFACYIDSDKELLSTANSDYSSYQFSSEPQEESRIGNLGQWSDDELKAEIEARNGDAPVKPLMKVEYVKVEFKFTWEAIKEFEEGVNLYRSETADTFMRICNTRELITAREAEDLYCKVETEIKTERRWVAVNVKDGALDKRLFKEPFMDTPDAMGNFQQIEITVEV